MELIIIMRLPTTTYRYISVHVYVCAYVCIQTRTRMFARTVMPPNKSTVALDDHTGMT